MSGRRALSARRSLSRRKAESAGAPASCSILSRCLKRGANHTEVAIQPPIAAARSARQTRRGLPDGVWQVRSGDVCGQDFQGPGIGFGTSFRDRRKSIPGGFGKNVLFFTIPKGRPKPNTLRVEPDAVTAPPATLSLVWRAEGRDRRLFFGGGIAARRVHRHRKLADIAALDAHDLAHALLLHFVDSQDRVQGQICTLYTGKFGLNLLFGRIDHDARTLAKNKFLDLDKTKKRAMAHLARIDLVDLALVHEHHLENVTGSHTTRPAHC